MSPAEAFEDMVIRRMKNTGETREEATQHLLTIIPLIAAGERLGVIKVRVFKGEDE